MKEGCNHVQSRIFLVDRLYQEIIGPMLYDRLTIKNDSVVDLKSNMVEMDRDLLKGPLFYQEENTKDLQEILYYKAESPDEKYGSAKLYPHSFKVDPLEIEAEEISTRNGEMSLEEIDDEYSNDYKAQEEYDEEFSINEKLVKYPSVAGISFLCSLNQGADIIIEIPQKTRLPWQSESSPDKLVNGRYIEGKIKLQKNEEKRMWYRKNFFEKPIVISISRNVLENRKIIVEDIFSDDCGRISIKIYPRQYQSENIWLLTAVLENNLSNNRDNILYQTFFSIYLKNGEMLPYPEYNEIFSKEMDDEEKNLYLLYSEENVYGLGHGCAAGYINTENGIKIFTDFMPACEIPNVTSDMEDDKGNPVRISMREMSELSDNPSDNCWASLESLIEGYEKWINSQKQRAEGFNDFLRDAALKNIENCKYSLSRIKMD